jgi:hypothetical protein
MDSSDRGVNWDWSWIGGLPLQMIIPSGSPNLYNPQEEWVSRERVEARLMLTLRQILMTAIQAQDESHSLYWMDRVAFWSEIMDDEESLWKSLQ